MARRDLVKRSRVPALPAPPPMALGHGGGIRSNFIRTALETVNRAGRRVIDCRKTNGQTHWRGGGVEEPRKDGGKKDIKTDRRRRPTTAPNTNLSNRLKQWRTQQGVRGNSGQARS